ncbi:3-oxoacyl-reductase [Rhexocercosporidium sp. MPI-PUGE-AT-0058]|nr:3-oxoacyl-reductase [Rhexocercosporidium sp. MPI-PUGE-AT-0058]
MYQPTLNSGCVCRPLEGKLAIVTGGVRGIGAGIAEALASKGCSIILGFTSTSSVKIANKTAAELSKSYDVVVYPVQADLGTATGPASLVSQAKELFADPATGKFQVDIIVNNAGISGIVPISQIKAEEVQNLYAVNVQGPLLLIQAAQSYLPNDRSGRIVNISSVSSYFGFVGQSVYAGTKAALDAMTRNWSRELAENATVNSVNPGPVIYSLYHSTAAGADFHKMYKPYMQIAPLAAVRANIDGIEAVRASEDTGGRAADVKEVAGVVLMLCSKEAGWCTGSVIPIFEDVW